jgi:hypothetical protein
MYTVVYLGVACTVVGPRVAYTVVGPGVAYTVVGPGVAYTVVGPGVAYTVVGGGGVYCRMTDIIIVFVSKWIMRFTFSEIDIVSIFNSVCIRELVFNMINI